MYREIFAITKYDKELKELELLSKLPISAKKKLKQLSQRIIKQIQEEEMFAAKIVFNTQLMLEQSKSASSGYTSYQTELYALAEKIIKQGQICYGRIAKGLLFLFAELSILFYFIIRGWSDIQGFFTLETQKGDAWLGVKGDNSVVMLLMGIFAWIVLAVFVILYRLNLKDAYSMHKRKAQGRSLLTFRQEMAQLFDKKFYVMVLALPIISVCIFKSSIQSLYLVNGSMVEQAMTAR